MFSHRWTKFLLIWVHDVSIICILFLNCFFQPLFLQAAKNNYFALKDFFKKFPEYEGRDFYITGESYGGIYVPTLSNLVMQDPNINLKVSGTAVGQS